MMCEMKQTVTRCVMTVCRASEEICNREPTRLASASLKIRATSKDSLWNTKSYVIPKFALADCPKHTQLHLVGVEADVAKVKNGGQDGPDGGDLVSVEPDGLKALNQKQEVLLVLLPI